MPPLIGKAEISEQAHKCCGSCSAWREFPQRVQNKEEQLRGFCCAHPPVPTMVGIAERKLAMVGAQGQQVPMFQYVRPQTTAHEWCREWQQK